MKLTAIKGDRDRCYGAERRNLRRWRPKPGTHAISVTYDRDKQTSRYAKDSDALDKLAGENAKRF
ncbi:hypothetical protein [Mesorhizobium sp. M0276]|uniref:hypothetical protein n=1 Tax=Mesorhizobium sp. M0276 TaxID=2956928 RepID=UPI0033373885